jgi:hypothetical protein
MYLQPSGFWNAVRPLPPAREGLPIRPEQGGFWNTIMPQLVNGFGGQPSSGGVSATSRGVAYPYGLPRTPAVQLNTPEMQRANDAQYVKFHTGQNPYVDATRRTVDQQTSTPIPLDVAARAYASGGGLQWDSLRGGWGSPNPGDSRGGPSYDTSGWNKKVLDFYSLLNQAQKPVGTPALNLFNQQFGQQQKLGWG